MIRAILKGRRGASTLPPLAIAGLLASALALALAPLFVSADYAWVAHTTSEAAGQGVEGAWAARLGFLLFGGAVLCLAERARATWGRGVTVLHRTFGALMIAAAAFSSRAWDASLPFDLFEDLLHSIAATAMGFAFALGVVGLLARRRARGQALRWLDVAAVGASIVIPLSMVYWGEVAGLLQRLMFLVAYAWYGREALGVFADEPSGLDPSLRRAQARSVRSTQW